MATSPRRCYAKDLLPSHAGIIEGNVQRNGNHPTAKSQHENRKENEKKNALEIKILEDAKRNGPGKVAKEIEDRRKCVTGPSSLSALQSYVHAPFASSCSSLMCIPSMCSLNHST